jgi:ATP-dependent helicase/nuclease subunit A
VTESDTRSRLADAGARALAETTFDRNVVVVAGAGTGKTTLLANRLIHLLMREPDPAKITEIVALTFTNKAAAEMKGRLRDRLLALASPATDGGAGDPGVVKTADLRDRYGLSSEEIADRARSALQDLEKAQIGTLHSFAAHLLRLYPIESGVDPDFREDDGHRFEEVFAWHWDAWLDEELGTQGQNHSGWRRILSIAELDQLRALARGLCSELVPLDDLIGQTESASRASKESPGLAPVLRAWFGRQHAHAAALLAAYDRPRRRKAESSLMAVSTLFQLLLTHGLDGVRALDDEARMTLARDLGDPPAGWTEEDFAACRSLGRTAKRVLAVDQDGMVDLLHVLSPFVRRVRATFLNEGWISFDGLLAKARALLRDHPGLRERLKRDYRAVLVDEFQDTDPSQYEIILFLTEQLGCSESVWRELKLAPGKLFIVGDPKQSIYAFRRADIEAFDQVLDKVRSTGGIVYELTTNFRSHESVLEVVNACFDRLFRPQENIQPANVSLRVRPDRSGGLSAPGVSLRLVSPDEDGEEFDAEAATRVEAEQLASWLKEELLGREVLTDAQGRRMPLKPGHVALLFRKLTQAQAYLDALRRHGIQYVTDGERHFYRRQEVVELVNVLRVVENPHDSVALFGVLRSPLGGLTDRDIYDLRQRGAFDYRAAHCLQGWGHSRAPIIQNLYARLAMLHTEAPLRPLPEVVDLLLTRLSLVELAAASLHGEQAVANLIKIRRIAAQLADRPHLSLTGFVELMIQQLSDQPEEAEGALGEESLEAVRVLTIHKAKGLEFPIVVLPGLHHGTNGGREEPLITHDWSTGVFGLAIGERFSLGAVMVGEKARLREEAEQRRLLYVGMTRAKDRLVLSGGLPLRKSRGSFVALLEEAAGTDIGRKEETEFRIGSVSVTQTVLLAPDRSPRRPREGPEELRPAPECDDFIKRWDEREKIWSRLRATPVRLTPSGLMAEKEPLLRNSELAAPYLTGRTHQLSIRARLVGTLAHRVLEAWDFQADASSLPGSSISDVCRAGVPVELADEQERIQDELDEMLRAFIVSPAYAELQRSTIVGREVPFAVPWSLPSSLSDEAGQQKDVRKVRGDPDVNCVMEGVIDVLYRLDGQTYIADYKTDRVEPEQLFERAQEYRVQADVYRRAILQCLGLKTVGVRLVFLRTGQVVQIA